MQTRTDNVDKVGKGRKGAQGGEDRSRCVGIANGRIGPRIANKSAKIGKDGDGGEKCDALEELDGVER